jgi:hypothetical protein
MIGPFGIAAVTFRRWAVPESVFPCSLHGSAEGVHDAEAGLLEMDAVSRDDRQSVDQSDGSDEAAFDGHSAPGRCEDMRAAAPPQACLRLPRQTAKLLDTRVKAPFEAATPPFVAQQKNTEAQLAVAASTMPAPSRAAGR